MTQSAGTRRQWLQALLGVSTLVHYSLAYSLNLRGIEHHHHHQNVSTNGTISGTINGTTNGTVNGQNNTCRDPGKTPINADCNFDIDLDVSIGFVNLTDAATFDQMYTPAFNPIIEDDLPSLGSFCRNPRACKRSLVNLFKRTLGLEKRQTSPVSLWLDVISMFQLNELSIIAASNQAYETDWDLLIYNYTDDGPSPPAGLSTCNPYTNPWYWCDSRGHLFIPKDDDDGADDDLPQDGIEDNDLDQTACLDSSTVPCPNAEYVSVSAQNGTASLWHNPDGNIYSFTPFATGDFAKNVALDSYFATVQTSLSGGLGTTLLLASSSGMLLHGYTDTMDAYGVSRLRMSHPEEMPATALPIALVPAANPGNMSEPQQMAPVVTAVDTSANVYYLLTCSFQNEYSKIFLVHDYQNGAEALLGTVSGVGSANGTGNGTTTTLLGKVTAEVILGCDSVAYMMNNSTSSF